MLLTIDIGNSNPHIGLFQDQELKKVFDINEFFSSSTWSEHTFNDFNIVYSAVGKIPDIIMPLILEGMNLNELRKDRLFLDMKVNYTQTLGADRLIQSYYAYKSFVTSTNETCLIIDMGTFTTFDLVDIQGYRGGLIFQGIRTSLNAYAQGHFLPNIETINLKKYCDHPEDLIAHNTEDAIEKALYLSICATWEKFFSIYPNIKTVLLTGGQSFLGKRVLDHLPFSNKLKIIHDPNFIHSSMQNIYKFVKSNVSTS